MKPLHAWLEAAASRRPDHPAVEEADGAGRATYAELAALAGRVRDRLAALGVGPGDRVGVHVTKSVDAVAAVFGVLQTGAAYVPVDPHGPPPRNAYILADCAVKALLAEERFTAGLRAEWGEFAPALLELAGTGGGDGLRAALDRLDARDGAPPPVAPAASAPDDLAYILYTSGSTGRPKGVMLSHRNAVTFVDWCSEALDPRDADRFSSHAPFHFDLSILDLYVPLKHGATLVLFGHELGKEPERLAAAIAGRRVTVWYSVPSILTLLVQYGDLPRQDLSSLRLVLFAGEVFPVKHLRALQRLLPAPRYLNLYGPTETNVCTWYEIPPRVPEERAEPYPIGKTCSHLRSRVVDEAGGDVARGEEGELVIAGPGVMQGYWNLEQQTAAAFLAGPDGARWYRTGDLVVEDERGDFQFHGRRDRMVKKRGFRVELGEIEDSLNHHPGVRQAAVVALSDPEGVKIKAWVVARDGVKLSVIALKRHCSERLPLYMVPDLFAFLPELPQTSTGKTDYRSLKEASA